MPSQGKREKIREPRILLSVKGRKFHDCATGTNVPVVFSTEGKIMKVNINNSAAVDLIEGLSEVDNSAVHEFVQLLKQGISEDDADMSLDDESDDDVYQDEDVEDDDDCVDEENCEDDCSSDDFKENVVADDELSSKLFDGLKLKLLQGEVLEFHFRDDMRLLAKLYDRDGELVYTYNVDTVKFEASSLIMNGDEFGYQFTLLKKELDKAFFRNIEDGYVYEVVYEEDNVSDEEDEGEVLDGALLRGLTFDLVRKQRIEFLCNKREGLRVKLFDTDGLIETYEVNSLVLNDCELTINPHENSAEYEMFDVLRHDADTLATIIDDGIEYRIE